MLVTFVYSFLFVNFSYITFVYLKLNWLNLVYIDKSNIVKLPNKFNNHNILSQLFLLSSFFNLLYIVLLCSNITSIVFFILAFNLYFFNLNSFNLNHVYSYIICFYTNLLIFLCDELFSLYLLLELNSYIFIFILLISSSTNNNFIYQNIVYYYILNFYSSIFLFIFILTLNYLYGPVLFLYNYSCISYFFLFFFLLKISTGPWMILNLNIYKGLCLKDLYLYTLIFFLSLLPKFCFILLTYQFNFNLFFFIIIFYIIFIYSYLNKISSLKSFLALSSSFLTCLLLITLLTFFNIY